MTMEMPRLGLGTWRMGGGLERDTRHDRAEVAAVRYALSLGYSMIDTAEVYGKGAAEEIVGEAMAGVARESVFLVSKVWNTNLRAADVIQAAEGSLARLGVSYLDLYLVHRPNPAIPIGETLSAMAELVARGMIRAIGVSNFDVRALAEAIGTGVPIAANQIEYNVLNRSAERDVIPFCRANGVRVMAHRPLGKGDLSLATSVLFEIAKKRGATPAQIALSFITSQEISAVPKASRNAHVKENWESQLFPLSAGELELLRGG